jgi:hypothetical protein
MAASLYKERTLERAERRHVTSKKTARSLDTMALLFHGAAELFQTFMCVCR